MPLGVGLGARLTPFKMLIPPPGRTHAHSRTHTDTQDCDKRTESGDDATTKDETEAHRAWGGRRVERHPGKDPRAQSRRGRPNPPTQPTQPSRRQDPRQDPRNALLSQGHKGIQSRDLLHTPAFFCVLAAPSPHLRQIQPYIMKDDVRNTRDMVERSSAAGLMLADACGASSSWQFSCWARIPSAAFGGFDVREADSNPLPVPCSSLEP